MFTIKRRTSLVAASLVSAALAGPVAAADLTVTIGPVTQSAGELMVAVYNSADTFSDTSIATQRAAAKEGDVVVTFNGLEAGEYAIMVFHDVNGNDKLDTNLLGIPSEPWGASLEGKRVFGAPGWDDTRFSVTDTNLSINITLN